MVAVLMLRQVRCECGYLARGPTDDNVIALILAHIASNHPDLAETETADDIRTLIELVTESSALSLSKGR